MGLAWGLPMVLPKEPVLGFDSELPMAPVWVRKMD
jgi:hypothetical protein